MSLIDIKRKHADRLRSQYPGIVGIGISEKTTNGISSGMMALTIYVQQKKPISALLSGERIDLDSQLKRENVIIDIKEIGIVRALSTKDRTRPVVGGISEGHFRITAGTGGLIVEDIEDSSEKFRISNNHVYADCNHSIIGDSILQPGPYDGGIFPTDVVGTLARFVPLDFQGSNTVDAAARTISNTEYKHILNLGIPTKLISAEVGQEVIKCGRTTEITVGKIVDLSLDIIVDYGSDGEVLFENQILVESDLIFSQGGDSGSPVFLNTVGELPWVGLLFAGSDDGKFTILNHATDVATLLKIRLPLLTPPSPSDPPPPTIPPTPMEKWGKWIGLWPILLLILFFIYTQLVY